MPNDPITGRGVNTGRTRFQKGLTPWNKGMTGIYSQDQLDKIALASKKRMSTSHPFKGKHHRLESRIQISQSLKAIIRHGNNVGYPDGWKNMTESIFKRDNYLCQECGSKLARVRGKGVIQCHHIDYDTSNNDPSNLITLCASCHARTGFNRADWMIRFWRKMNRS